MSTAVYIQLYMSLHFLSPYNFNIFLLLLLSLAGDVWALVVMKCQVIIKVAEYHMPLRCSCFQLDLSFLGVKQKKNWIKSKRCVFIMHFLSCKGVIVLFNICRKLKTSFIVTWYIRMMVNPNHNLSHYIIYCYLFSAFSYLKRWEEIIKKLCVAFDWMKNSTKAWDVYL